MALDQSFVGRKYPPTEPYEVGREKIREFADAIGDPNPAYRDADAARALGHPDVIAPPTFAIVLSMRAGAQVVADPALAAVLALVGRGRIQKATPATPEQTIETVKEDVQWAKNRARSGRT